MVTILFAFIVRPNGSSFFLVLKERCSAEWVILVAKEECTTSGTCTIYELNKNG